MLRGRLDYRQLAARGYDVERCAGALCVARADALEFVRDALGDRNTLYEFAARHPEAESLKGRATVYVCPGPGTGRWVVRHLSHGGLLAPLTGDRFPRIGIPRPFNELLVALRLEEIGIPTPRVAAAVVYPSLLTYRGDVAREEISDAIDLAACLFGPRELEGSRRLHALAAAGRLLGALHRAGVVHPDLNLRNLLVRSKGEIARAYVLDVEKCRIVPRLSNRVRRAMLRRLRRSARRFEVRTAKTLRGEEWEAFQAGYTEYYPAERPTTA